MDSSRFYAEIREAKVRAQKFYEEAETRRLLHQARPGFSLRSALATQLRAAAEHLEPQPKPKGIL